MTKYILVVDGELSTKYKYNLWEVHQYEDGAISENNRIIYEDDRETFLQNLESFLKNLDNQKGK